MKVLVNSSDTEGCGTYRISEPYANITSDIEFHLNTSGTIMPEVAMDYDAIVLQRPTEKEIIYFIQELRENGKTVIIEIDDDLFSIPKTNPIYTYYNKERLDIFQQILDNADHVHVSTPQLKNRIKHKSVHVFLNAINFKKYGNKEEIKKEIVKKHSLTLGKIVMWSGGIHHVDSLEIIFPVIQQLIRKKITVVMNCGKDWLNAIGFQESEHLRIINNVPIEEYHNILSIADVALAPLPDYTFNRAKSELKCLEFGAWGIPCVCSPAVPFERFNKLTDGNILVKNDKPKHWMEAIESLLADENLYKDKSEKSLNGVKTIYNLETINKQRSEWWDKNLVMTPV